MDILDLNKFAPEPREIHLNGKVIKIPGDLPVGLMLELLRVGNEVDDDPLSQLDKSVSLMVKIIQLEKNDVDREWIEGLGRAQFIAIQNFILGKGGEESSDEDSEGNSEKKVMEEEAES